MSTSDERRHAPATDRNRNPILAVLRGILPPAGLALEIASGTGEHAVHFARALPYLDWQPTDPSPEALLSIAAWAEGADLPNLRAPLELDASAQAWPVTQAEAVLCINMIHISPWSATEGLLRGAGRVLAPGALLYLYGPFRRTGHSLEPSNAAFDLDLRRRDPSWGLRELDEVTACAAGYGFERTDAIEMPANNLSVVFRKA